MTRAVVVGGGPAGCAAAASLVAAGVDVVLLERGSTYRDKPCGDAFMPDAVTALRSLGVEPLAVAGARPFDEVGLYATGREVWRTAAGGDGVVAPRAAVDQALRDALSARCELRYGCRVFGIERAWGGWMLSVGDAGRDGAPPHRGAATTLLGELLVLAVGANGRLQAEVGIPFTSAQGRSLSVYVVGSGSTSADFHFAATPFPGYAWEFPLAGGRANAGVCSINHGPVAMRPALDRFLAERRLVPVGRPRGGAAPLFIGNQLRWHDDRGAVVCGDAAGLVDALTGEGIGAALESGRLAGGALAAFAAGDRQALTGYSTELHGFTAARQAPSAARMTWERLTGMPAGIEAPER